MEGALSRPGRPQENPMLRQIIDNAESKVPDNLREQYDKIMTVAGKMMWSAQMGEERQAFEQAVQQSNDVPTVVSHTVIKVVGIIQNESGVKEPMAAMGLAAPVIMAHLLQYVEAKMKVPVSKEIIDETGKMVQVNLLKAYGVTEEQLKGILAKGAQGQDGQQPQGQPGDLAQASDGQMQPPAEGAPAEEEATEEESAAPAEDEEEEEA